MSKTVQVVERTIEVLFAVGSTKEGLGVTEIAEAVGLSKSTVHRILTALANKMMVQQDPDSKRYVIGPKVLELGQFFAAQLDIVTLAQPFLKQLQEQFQETASLAIRTGFTYLYVITYPSPNEYRMNPVIGKPFPLHWTGFGKAILAGLSKAELAAYLSRDIELAPATDKTITNPGRLAEELQQIQERGVAISIGERVEGAVAIASAIMNGQENPVGAIGLALPETRLGQLDQDQVAQALRQAAQNLSAALARDPHKVT